MGITTISNGILTVEIASTGAELRSIRDQAGTERLWQGDPAFWAGRAPILFPVAGGLINDQYTLRGKTYTMQKHGYVRKLEWTPEEVSADRASFVITAKDPGFPFEYALHAIYQLKDSSIEITYRVENRDSESFWFGLGAHEGYAAPGGIDHYRLVFDEEETFANNELEGNFIKPEPVILADNTNVFPLKEEYFAVDALVFRTLKSRGVVLENNLNSRKIRVDYPGHDVLMLWTRPGAGYLCIEPWCNAPDQTDADGCIEHKPGCICLQSGESAEKTHVITILA